MHMLFLRQGLLCSLGWSPTLVILPQSHSARITAGTVNLMYLLVWSCTHCHYSLESKDLVSFIPDSLVPVHSWPDAWQVFGDFALNE